MVRARKTSPLTRRKLANLLVTILQESDGDRVRAEELYSQLRDQIKDPTNATYSEDLKSVVKALELLSTIRANSIKTIETLAKLESAAREANAEKRKQSGLQSATTDVSNKDVFSFFDRLDEKT